MIAWENSVDCFVVKLHATLAHLSDTPDEHIDAFAEVTMAARKPDLQSIDGIVDGNWNDNGCERFPVLVNRQRMPEFQDIYSVVSTTCFSSDDAVISAYFVAILSGKMRAS